MKVSELCHLANPLASCLHRLTTHSVASLPLQRASHLLITYVARNNRVITTASSRSVAQSPPPQPPRNRSNAFKAPQRGAQQRHRDPISNPHQKTLQSSQPAAPRPLPRIPISLTPRPTYPSPPMDPDASRASLLLVQNMMALCKQLRLPVSYKVYEWQESTAGPNGSDPTAAADTATPTSPTSSPSRRFSMVVQVHGDHAFKKYLQQYSSSDLLLYRGLLLQVEASPDLSRVTSARVQQAFLPKFENEGQDTAVADAIVNAAANGRPTVVTIKHSGSLVTLSYDGGWAAKNSVANEFTAGGAALLRAHYDRLHPANPAAAAAALDRLFATLAARRLSLSFEMVTASHGHHGQLPAAEYLVTTAAHTAHTATAAPHFLPWLPFLELCAELQLPTNDTWLLGGGAMAAAARQALDTLALHGGPTGHAVATLGALVAEGGGGEGGEGSGCLYLAGSYPHAEWQGERLEGFVVAAGQELGEKEMRRLRALQSTLAATRLPLAAVPEQLRRPYYHKFRELQNAAATAAKAAAAPTATAAPPPPSAIGVSDAVRQRLQTAAAEWVPHSAVQYGAVPAADRERLTAALADQGQAAAGAVPYIELPNGSGRMYSRRALAALGAPQLAALLLSEAEAAEAAADSHRAQSLLTMAAEVEAAANAPPTDMMIVRAMAALSGRPETAVQLRYKKKMLMWTFPDPAPAPTSTTTTNAGGVVGYSLMTFVIRNGIPALRQGAATYWAYVDNLVRRSWALPPTLVAQVQHFARCWSAWVAARGGASALQPESYLQLAEPFAAEWLASRGNMGARGRPDTAFQGILLCIDTPESLTSALRTRLAPSLELSPAKLGDSPFSKGMVPGGCMIRLQPGSEPPRKLREFLSSGAAPFTWVISAAPSRPISPSGDGAPEAKRQKGMAAAKVATVTAALGPDGAAKRHRQVTLPDVEDDVEGDEMGQRVVELVAWLGRGSPLPPADPAVAAYFVTIPGAGKSALVRGMEVPAGKAGGVKEVTVKVLNSDTLRKTVKGFNPNRYWQDVAAAADSCRGSGHAVLAVADKNLVPSPPGNIARALEPIKGTGTASLALVPVVAGPSSANHPAPSQTDLYGGLPALPFPLELIALCMMRTLQRKNHEGGLDGATTPSAATIVAMFAGFYRHKTLPDLTSGFRDHFTRVAELPIMKGDGLGAAEAGAGGGGGSVPADVLRHVAAGVRDVNERSKPQLPAEWETRARELLLRPDTVAALEALQLPIETVRQHVEREVADTLDAVQASASGAGASVIASAPSVSTAISHMHIGGADAAATTAADATAAGDGLSADAAAGSVAPEERVMYFSLSGFDEAAVRSAAREVLPPEYQGRLKGGSLHVTLWHRNAAGPAGAGGDVRRSLYECVGSAVEMEMIGVDISPEIIAAEVRLLSADEVLTVKPYHHITLMVEKGRNAAEANMLPARLAAGEPGVERRPLPGGPLLLSGVVTAVEEETGRLGTGGGGGKRPPVV